MLIRYAIALILLVAVHPVFALNDNPCLGPNEILNITNGGGHIFSPCVVPAQKILASGEYEYQTFKPVGTLESYPEIEIRIGLPGSSELRFLLPNYLQLKEPSIAGTQPLLLSSKHQAYQGGNWLVSVDVELAFPGGSSEFGSSKMQGSLSGIASYAINDKWSLNTMLEWSSFTEPPILNSERYNVFSPDLSVNYSASDRVVLFSELFWQSAVGVNEPGVTVADAGFLYMINPHFEVDFTFFKQLGNNNLIYQKDFMVGFTLYS